MKKLILLFELFNSVAYSQWTYKTVDNGKSEPYTIAYTDLENDARLKLENVNGKIVFYLSGRYTFDKEVSVDLSFLINGEYVSYTFTSMTSKDHTSVFFSWDLENSIADNDFKVCSELKVKINDTTGEPKSYNFNMKGCNLAFNYMKG